MADGPGVLTIIIAVATSSLLAASAIGWLMLRRQQQLALAAQQRQAEHEARFSRAVWAGATIVNVGNSVSAANGRRSRALRVDLRLEVQPPGGSSYETTARWLADETAFTNLHPGQTIPVKIDAEDPYVIYPNVIWARFWLWD